MGKKSDTKTKLQELKTYIERILTLCLKNNVYNYFHELRKQHQKPRKSATHGSKSVKLGSSRARVSDSIPWPTRTAGVGNIVSIQNTVPVLR